MPPRRRRAGASPDGEASVPSTPETESLENASVASEEEAAGARTRAKKKVQYTEPELDEFDSHQHEDRDGDEPDNNDACEACGRDEDSSKLLCCEACPSVYHLYCLDPPMTRVPRGDWFCPKCSSLLSLLAVERFLDVRDVPASKADQRGAQEAADAGASNAQADASGSKAAASADPVPPDREYFVKWLERSYMHCSWVSESQLHRAMKMFKGRAQGVKSRLNGFWRMRPNVAQQDNEAEETGDVRHGVRPAWLLVDRVVAERPSCTSQSGSELLVKWQELGYDLCSWEQEDDLPEFKAEVERFRARGPIKDDVPTHAEAASLSSGDRAFAETPDFLTGGTLHPYQLEGLNWLYNKWANHEHVILADEMGLGKTVQTISLLAALNRVPGCKRPHIIVVPLSTIRNWERELAMWAPFLNVVVMLGNSKARKVVIDHELFVERTSGGRKSSSLQARVKFHVLLTSYEMALAEAGALSKIDYEVMVVDEGHRLKNSKSRLFVELKSFKAAFKVLLTGTPLQNNLTELYMLLHFLEPAKFRQEDFEESDFEHEQQVANLHKQLGPHILRRLKKDVLKGLPPKMEQIVRVELSPMQRELYRSLLARHLPVLGGSRAASLDPGLRPAGPTVTALKNLVMQLRKACNHPFLFPDMDTAANVEEYRAALVANSGKLQLLDNMLKALIADGHRTLIYSQFTQMLNILEDWLRGRGWGYQRIDGSVAGAERQRRIDRFNNSPETNHVFLLSTRAGGVGINLASADTVIIFDSDWNPHNDLQAMARAHRMGQKKPVMMYRLVTRATVEERMIQTSRKKLLLEHLVVRKMGKGRDGQAGGQLKQSELDDILRYGAQELFAEDEPAAARSSATEGPDQGSSAPEAAPSVSVVDGSAGNSAGVSGKVASAATPEPAVIEGAAAAAAAAAAPAAALPSATAAPPEKQTGKADAPAEQADPSKTAVSDPVQAPANKPSNARIVWDNDAVARLLDRSELLARVGIEEEDDGDDDLMKAFKVANFTMREEQDEIEKKEEVEKAPDPEKLLQVVCPDQGPGGGEFWDKLLRERHEQFVASEATMLGRGKRERAKVKYFDEEEAFDAAGQRKKKRARADADSEFSASAGEEDSSSSSGDLDRDPEAARRSARPGSESLPVVGAEHAAGALDAASIAAAAARAAQRKAETQKFATSPDGQILIHGLNDQERRLVLDTLMQFGINAANGNQLMYAPFVKALSYKPQKDVVDYCDLLIDCVSVDLAEEPHILPSSVPFDALFFDVPREAVLGRIGFLHLARLKIVDAVRRRIFDLSTSGVEELSGTRMWGPNQDAALLHAIIRYGYGRWAAILADTGLGLSNKLDMEIGLASAAEKVAWLERRVEGLSSALNLESEREGPAQRNESPQLPESSTAAQPVASPAPAEDHVTIQLLERLKSTVFRSYRSTVHATETVKNIAHNAQEATRQMAYSNMSPAFVFRNGVAALAKELQRLQRLLPAAGTTLAAHVRPGASALAGVHQLQPNSVPTVPSVGPHLPASMRAETTHVGHARPGQLTAAHVAASETPDNVVGESHHHATSPQRTQEHVHGHSAPANNSVRPPDEDVILIDD